MKAIFYNKKVSGILGIIPEKISCFDDEIQNYNFPEKQTKRLKKIMGFEKHRLVKEQTSSSDLCLVGINHLISKNQVKIEEVGALIVVTSTPDYLMPQVSSIIHGEIGFPEDVVCMDINQGCTGFVTGLMQSFMLLEYIPKKKILLFNVDVLSKKVSKHDRNSYPLIGDAATITVIENAPSASIYYNFYNDGKGRDALIIPAGGSRLKSSEATAKLEDLEKDGNLRSLDNLKMNGSEVFSFVQTKVPPLIEEILEYSNQTKEDIDWFLFHQPNKFMLKKLAEKIEVPYEKMPMNLVENYGNSSGATIPMTIIHNFSNSLLKNKFNCCLAGFGSGLSWGAITMELGELDFCELLDSNC